ncbi:LPS assembly protein LptD [Acetobacter sp. AN02]|nr:LPS assembly protein LptD [Acetobacter sp. AN02]MDG6093815.1 LPS assembly protein LptD [Acetobacter sp. AN02]
MTALGLGIAPDAHAQFRPAHSHLVTVTPTRNDDPVTFQSDKVDYDDPAGRVTWTGNVQVWQGQRVMRADMMTYDRNTGVLAARGHVAMVQPDGTVVFSSYAEVTGNMRDGIMTKVSTLMAEDARMAANGMRRTGGKINDMSRAVYTACPVCEKDPSRPPFWQFRAWNATQDTEHGRIDFQDAWLEFFGVPVIYMPFFSMPDPSQKRKSGFLIPGITPHDRYMGTYFTIPYYWVIDDSSDLTAQLLIPTKTGPQIGVQYRKEFNFGTLRFRGAVADDRNKNNAYTNVLGQNVGHSSDHGIQGYGFLDWSMTLTKSWRAGASIKLASSADYMRDYRISGYGNDTLNSRVFLEGFGTGAYSRVETQMYQGLNRGVIHDSELPFALPYYQYSFLGQPDAWGGRFGLDTHDFYVYRPDGATDQRGELALHWDRPFRNSLGQKFLLQLRVDSMLYHAKNLNEQPNYYGHQGSAVQGQVQPTIGIKMNWPFLRSFAKGHGSQIFEPIAQIIYSPNTGNSANSLLPNEDSFSYEFTDSTLFSLNRWQGTDRLDSGLRANVGVHGSWVWNGHEVDVLVGQSYQQHIQRNMVPYSGLNHRISDVVGRIRAVPNRFFQFTARGRISPYTGKFNFGDALFSAGVSHFRINGGYVYGPTTPYYYYAEYGRNQNYRNSGPPVAYYEKTNEITGGASTYWRNWHASGFARRSLSRKEFVSLGGSVGFQNDCFGLDFMYIKQYTMIGGQSRNSSFLVTFTLKSIGSFGVK